MAAGTLALAVPSFANAAATVQVIGGRERIKVTVSGTQYPVEHCLVDPDADGRTQSIPMRPNGILRVDNQRPGAHRVMVWCPQGGVVYRGQVDVQPGNPALELQDQLFAATGSGDRVSDPTLR
ncbi:MAG: hypothetical protein HOQ24_03380 [Mycobacteriaceae bacterium]|nr:hypothetical protein [Mycobacteriaceae bacterium]